MGNNYHDLEMRNEFWIRFWVLGSGSGLDLLECLDCFVKQSTTNLGPPYSHIILQVTHRRASLNSGNWQRKETRRNQHSPLCKDPRRQCFYDTWPWHFDFLPQNKWVTRTHRGQFLCQGCWS